MKTSSKCVRSVLVPLMCGLFWLATATAATNFPSKPIRFLVPYGSGGSPDVISRVIGKKLGENIGQQVIVDNRPGAGGIIAAEAAMKAPPDGYTLFIADTGHLAINPALYKKLPYDPLRDFVPITLAVSTPLFIVGNAQLPFTSAAELTNYAKAHPGVPFGSSGNGSVHHLGMELFKLMAGVSMTHIPYKGVAQSVPALIRGDVAVIFAALPSVLPHVKSGKVRLIGVGTASRAPMRPEVPTISESGVPGYEIKVEIGFLAPAGTPPELIERLNREIVSALKAPEVEKRLISLGIQPVGSSPRQYAEVIRADQKKFGELVTKSGARVD